MKNMQMLQLWAPYRIPAKYPGPGRQDGSVFPTIACHEPRSLAGQIPPSTAASALTPETVCTDHIAVEPVVWGTGG